MEVRENPYASLPIEEQLKIGSNSRENWGLVKPDVLSTVKNVLIPTRNSLALLVASGDLPAYVLAQFDSRKKLIDDRIIDLSIDRKPEENSGAVVTESDLEIMKRVVATAQLAPTITFRASSREAQEGGVKPKKYIIPPERRGIPTLHSFPNGLAARLGEDERWLVTHVPILDIERLKDVTVSKMVSAAALANTFFEGELAIDRVTPKQAREGIDSLVGRTRRKIIPAGAIIIRDLFPQPPTPPNTDLVTRYFMVLTRPETARAKEEAKILDLFLDVFNRRNALIADDFYNLQVALPRVGQMTPWGDPLPMPYYAPEAMGNFAVGFMKAMGASSGVTRERVLALAQLRGVEPGRLMYRISDWVAKAEDMYYQANKPKNSRRSKFIRDDGKGVMAAPTKEGLRVEKEISDRRTRRRVESLFPGFQFTPPS